MRIGIVFLIAFFSYQSSAKSAMETFGSDKAPRGGTLNLNLDSEPEILKPDQSFGSRHIAN